PRDLTPQQAAALLVAFLERHGAVFTLDLTDHTFKCALDGCRKIESREEAERMSGLISSLKDEIRAELLARRTTH
ncbi:MAG TPA: hypothetical protein VN903_30160, partial [Polyangia bacterium]|nr:hypothetical protein [Polyangia bacterium]